MTGPPPELLRRKTLHLEEVTVSFDGFKALDGLSLTVDPGELRCIIGPNGAGKTTMMDVVTGKTRPDRGSAWFGPAVNPLTLSEPEIAQAGGGHADRRGARHGLRPLDCEARHGPPRRARVGGGRHGPGAERSARHRRVSRGMTGLAVRALNQCYGGSHTLWDVDLAVPVGAR